MKKLEDALPLLLLILAAVGCGGETKKEEEKSGRLSFVKTLGYGSVGTHGSQGWYVKDRNFYVNGSRWSPSGSKMDDIGDCDASPNKDVEALKCSSFADMKESAFILRMKSGRPEWVTASDMEYKGGKNFGKWTGDGKWLIFLNYYFNVETSEKREIKGLPDFPEQYFIGTSPDLRTIVYEETGFDGRYDLPPGADVAKEREKQYKVFYDHIDKGIRGYWLIDSETGKTTVLELKKEQYDWLAWDSERFPSKADWHDYFMKQFVWEKDNAGKYQLVYPK